jgi:hypothetical protein
MNKIRLFGGEHLRRVGVPVRHPVLGANSAHALLVAVDGGHELQAVTEGGNRFEMAAHGSACADNGHAVAFHCAPGSFICHCCGTPAGIDH